MNVEISSLKRPQGLFLAAAVLRLALFFLFPSLPELVAGRVEVSTPVNSFKRCTCWSLDHIYRALLHVSMLKLTPDNSARRPIPI